MKNHAEEEVLNPVEGAAAETEAATLPNELEQLKGENAQLLDRLARLQAEFDNARKRASKEQADFRDYAVAGAVEQFLPVLDNFQLALAHAPENDPMRTGVELIVKQMEDALKNLGVVKVETVGTQFDPRQHEALESVETAEYPDNQVLAEVRRGYKIKERLLRPALVKIASNSAEHKA
jgi:molecular chaperone GrpE